MTTAFQGDAFQGDAFQVGGDSAGGDTLPRDAVVSPRVSPRQVGQTQFALNLLLTTLAVVSTAPFSQDDWQNPVRARQVQQVEQVTNRLPLATIAFRQTDWQNPQAKKIQQVEQAANLYETLLVVAPDSTTLFREPVVSQRLTRTVQQPDQVSSRAILAVVAANSPFKQTEWPNPLQKKPYLQTAFDQNPQFYTTQSYYPIDNQWPNPKWTYRQQPEQTVSRLAITTVVVAGTPFAQEDWPNPIKAKSGQDFASQNLLGLNAVAPDTGTLQRANVYTQRFVRQQPDQNQYQNFTILRPVTPTPTVTVDLGGKNPWRVKQQQLDRLKQDDEDFIAMLTKVLPYL